MKNKAILTILFVLASSRLLASGVYPMVATACFGSECDPLTAENKVVGTVEVAVIPKGSSGGLIEYQYIYSIDPNVAALHALQIDTNSSTCAYQLGSVQIWESWARESRAQVPSSVNCVTVGFPEGALAFNLQLTAVSKSIAFTFLCPPRMIDATLSGGDVNTTHVSTQKLPAPYCP